MDYDYILCDVSNRSLLCTEALLNHRTYGRTLHKRRKRVADGEGPRPAMHVFLYRGGRGRAQLRRSALVAKKFIYAKIFLTVCLQSQGYFLLYMAK